MKNEKKDFFLGTKYILLTCMKIIIATNLIKNIVFGPSIHLIWEHFNLPVFLNLAQKERAIREFSNSKRKFVFDFFCLRPHSEAQVLGPQPAYPGVY